MKDPRPNPVDVVIYVGAVAVVVLTFFVALW